LYVVHCKKSSDWGFAFQANVMIPLLAEGCNQFGMLLACGRPAAVRKSYLVGKTTWRTNHRRSRLSLTMKHVNSTPARATAPGATIRREIEERGWTQVQFAQILGRPPQHISELLNGKRLLTPETAIQLEAALDVPVRFWLARGGPVTPLAATTGYFRRNGCDQHS
jgi:hypothetical protein